MQAHLSTTPRRRTKAGLATVAAAALVTSGVGFAAPANAETESLAYTCTTPIGDQTFTVVHDSNAPTKTVVGKTTAIQVASEVTIPANLSELAYGALGARTIDGTAVLQGAVASTPNESNLTVPSTVVPETGELVVVASGAFDSFTASDVGTYSLSAGDFSADLTFRKEDNSEALAIQTQCTAPEGADTVLDTITVGKDKTKIAKLQAKKTVAQHTKPQATVKVKSANGLTPTGKAVMIVKKGKSTIQKKNVTLNGSGVAKATFKKLHNKGAYKLIAKYTGSQNFKGSQKVKTFRVK